MNTHLNWTNWFTNHVNNDAGNRNLQAFSDILGEDVLNETKLRDLVEEIDTVILAADSNRNVILFHSPKNFGGTRSRPENKVSCLIGLGDRATAVLLDLNTAFQNLQMTVPSVRDLSECESAEEITNLALGVEIGFGGSAIFIPGPVLRNTIIESNSRDPFELIPIIFRAARSFDLEHQGAGAVTHADDLCAWLYGMKVGQVTETRYSVNPDDAEVSAFYSERHFLCITSGQMTGQ
jgi:hypothetical protein